MASTNLASGAPPKPFAAIHHIKLPSFDIVAARDFYATHLQLTYLPELDHRDPKTGEIYAMLLKHEPSSTILELRQHAEAAAKQKGWDPITWAVATKKDLDDWVEYWERAGLRHSPVFTAVVGWVAAVEDPDGKIVKAYTLETHEWSDETDHDEYWLGN